MNDQDSQVGAQLNTLLAEAGLATLDAGLSHKFESYLSLLLRWGSKINLTAIREVDGILVRHFVESIACAQVLPAGIRSLLDFGSGAGFPGIPIALCRPEIAVTLAESQGKKAAFLNEAVRELGIQARVHGQRAETLAGGFDCVTLRAVDRMERAVEVAGQMVHSGGWLVLMTTGGQLVGLQEAAGRQYDWKQAIPLPGGEDRLLSLGFLRPPSAP